MDTDVEPKWCMPHPDHAPSLTLIILDLLLIVLLVFFLLCMCPLPAIIHVPHRLPPPHHPHLHHPHHRSE
eukprot:9472584-Pyramimonas_sp.AAC.1